MKKYFLNITVNGREEDLEIPAHRTLLEVLREDLGLTGTKEGCGEGVCGACTVLVDGKPARACLTLALEVEGRNITTIEGLSKDGLLDPLQEAFVSRGAVQCGFCTPGMIMASKALLEENPCPSEDDIKYALAGHFCRCTGYAKILDAVKAAAVSESAASDADRGE
ncbi:MAG: (2Fe-2S)-binding protein [Desulfomonilaceae bacterium]